jgi:hypothetical protein
MKVEVIGLPGAGKTTILNRIKEIGVNDNLKLICDRRYSHYSCLIYFMLFFVKFIALYPKPLIWQITKLRWLINKLSYRFCSYKNKYDNSICLFPENGMLMPLISFVVQRDEKNIALNIPSILKFLPKPRAVIVVESNTNTIVDRYSKRGGIKYGGTRKDVIVSDDLYNRFSKGLQVIDEIVNILSVEGVEILKINNEIKISDDELRFFIKRLRDV